MRMETTPGSQSEEDAAGRARRGDRAAMEAVAVEFLRVREHVALGRIEHAAAREHAGVERHPFGRGLRAHGEDGLAVAERERVGRRAAVPHQRDAAVRHQDARELLQRLVGAEPVERLGDGDERR